MNQAFKIRCPLPHCTGWVTQLDPEDGSLPCTAKAPTAMKPCPKPKNRQITNSR